MSKNKRLSFHSCEIVGEYLFFSALNCNGLYRMRINGKQAEFIGTFPNEEVDQRHLHGAIKAYEGKLYLAPYNGNYLNIFDINEEKFTSIDLTPYTGDIKGKFYGMLIYDRKVILIPSRAKSIIVYDIDFNCIECHSEWVKTVDISINERIPQIKNGSFIYADKLYIPYGKYAAILEINLNNFESKSINYENIECGFVDAIFSPENGNVYLLANGKGSIYELKLSTFEIVEYSSNEEFIDVEFPFIKMIDMPNTILLVMYQAKYSLLFDKSTHGFEKVKFDISNSVCDKEWNANFYSANRISSDEIILMGTGDYLISIIDNLCALKSSFFLEDDMIMARLLSSRDEVFFREKEDMDIEDFLSYTIYSMGE